MYDYYTLDDVKQSSERKLFTFADFFAGGGGSSTGLKLAGGHELWMNEFVDEACNTFKDNYPQTTIVQGDIKELDGQHFLDVAGIKKGEIDIISGSPPCSAFSVAGKGSKGWKQTKTYSDGKKVENIEDLFFEYIRVLNDIQPKVIIAENVAGLTQGPAKEYLVKILNAFNDIGYEASYRLMEACDYGVPQTRKRCIFIAIRKDICEALGFDLFGVPGNIFPRPIKDNDVSLKTAIEDMENDPEEVQELLDYVQGGFQKNVITKLPFNPSRHVKPSDKEFKKWNPKGSFFNMIRPAPHLPCPTITQRGNQKSVSGVFHYAYNRKFTIKELKRIMALPEDYKLTGTFDQRAERIGRMVVPVMMKYIGESIYENVLVPYNKKVNK